MMMEAGAMNAQDIAHTKLQVVDVEAVEVNNA